MTVRINDKNNIPDLIKVLDELNSLRVEIGVFGDDDAHVLMIARVHEFGVEITVTDKMRGWFAYQGYPLRSDTNEIVIPERSFIRSAYDENEKNIGPNTEKLIQGVLDFKIEPEQAFDRIGQWLVSKIQQKMKSVSSPSNADMTSERKGSGNPLIDSGHLRQSITWRVVQD